MKYFHINKMAPDTSWVVGLMTLIQGSCLHLVYHCVYSLLFSLFPDPRTQAWRDCSMGTHAR